MPLTDGACHCGAVALALARRPSSITKCNCSICWRYGALWAYATRPHATITGKTVAYRANARVLRFHRCATCGCVTHWASPTGARLGVNVRLFGPDAIAGIRVHYFDGATTWQTIHGARWP